MTSWNGVCRLNVAARLLLVMWSPAQLVKPADTAKSLKRDDVYPLFEVTLVPCYNVTVFTSRCTRKCKQSG